MGIIKIEYINADVLVKQGFKVLIQVEYVWIRLVKAKYLKITIIFLLENLLRHPMLGKIL